MVDLFEQHRPLLFSIAYRMLGSAMEAEDIVQETYLRYRATPSEEIRNLKAFLSTVVTRLCLDQLKSARVQRESYIGPWLPEPIFTGSDGAFTASPAGALSRYDTISMAFLVLLETLTPVERAVFLLREVFEYDYAEIAAAVGRSEAACRQIFSRARKRIAANKPRFDSTPEQHRAMIENFIQAVRDGEIEGLMDLLAEDVTVWSDGGGKTIAARRPVSGREMVARLIFGIAHMAAPGTTVRVEEVNGFPAIVIRIAERIISVMTFELEGAVIKAIRTVLNPDKLAYLNASATRPPTQKRQPPHAGEHRQ